MEAIRHARKMQAAGLSLRTIAAKTGCSGHSSASVSRRLREGGALAYDLVTMFHSRPGGRRPSIASPEVWGPKTRVFTARSTVDHD
jgi:hypothetical protein